MPGHAGLRGVTVTLPPACVAAEAVTSVRREKFAVSTVEIGADVGAPNVPSPSATCHVN